MYSIVPAANFTLATTSGVQAAFPTTGDVWTVNANTSYLVEGQYYITKTTTSVTTAIAFALATATLTSMKLSVWATNAAANTTATAGNFTLVDQVASTVVTAATTGNVLITFKGIMRFATAGTVTPQINFSAATTTPVMSANSYITLTPIGTNTNDILGNVA
jgi:hypothetical protein